MTWTVHSITRTEAGRYAYISPEAGEIIGSTPEQLIAEPEHFPRLVHPDDLERVTR